MAALLDVTSRYELSARKKCDLRSGGWPALHVANMPISDTGSQKRTLSELLGIVRGLELPIDVRVNDPSPADLLCGAAEE
jgi:hypothetical protein